MNRDIRRQIAEILIEYGKSIEYLSDDDFSSLQSALQSLSDEEYTLVDLFYIRHIKSNVIPCTVSQRCSPVLIGFNYKISISKENYNFFSVNCFINFLKTEL